MALPQRDDYVDQIRRLEGLMAFAERRRDWEELERRHHRRPAPAPPNASCESREFHLAPKQKFFHRWQLRPPASTSESHFTLILQA